jgi:hypothetical protein
MVMAIKVRIVNYPDLNGHFYFLSKPFKIAIKRRNEVNNGF